MRAIRYSKKTCAPPVVFSGGRFSFSLDEPGQHDGDLRRQLPEAKTVVLKTAGDY